MDKFEKEASAAVKADSFEGTCLKCAFYPGGGSWMCLAPWPDIMFEDFDPCYEGVYRYLSGKPGPNLKRLLDRGGDWVRIREKGKSGFEKKEAPNGN